MPFPTFQNDYSLLSVATNKNIENCIGNKKRGQKMILK